MSHPRKGVTYARTETACDDKLYTFSAMLCYATLSSSASHSAVRHSAYRAVQLLGGCDDGGNLGVAQVAELQEERPDGLGEPRKRHTSIPDDLPRRGTPPSPSSSSRGPRDRGTPLVRLGLCYLPGCGWACVLPGCGLGLCSAGVRLGLCSARVRLGLCSAGVRAVCRRDEVGCVRVSGGGGTCRPFAGSQRQAPRGWATRKSSIWSLRQGQTAAGVGRGN